MSWLERTLLQHEEEEQISEQASEYGFSYSQCSSLPSEPLDLSMKPWFDKLYLIFTVSAAQL